MSRIRYRPLLLLCLVAAGCSSPAPENEPDRSTTEAPRGGTFRIAQDPPGGLDPARLDDSYEAAIVNQLFDGLLSHDANLTPIPAIARSWTIARDGLSYLFQLREGVRFHDGSECTSEDVIYSLTRVFRFDRSQSELARGYLSPIQGSRDYSEGLADRISGLEALGPYELRITLDQPHAAFLSVLASETSRIVPKNYVERVGDDQFCEHPIGAGPFRFVSWKPGRDIVLTRFEDYYASKAQLDSVIFELPEVGHRDYAADHFVRNRITAIEVQANFQDQLDQMQGVQVLSRQELSLAYMALNVAKSPFDDPRVRKAMLLAVDREAIAAQHPTGRYVTRGILPPGMPGYDPDEKLPPFDPESARALLAEAGFDQKNPLPSIIHASANESASERAVHDELRRQLSEVGMQLETVYLNWLEFDERIRKSEFHVFTLTWVADLPDPDSFLSPLFHSDGSNNLYRYDNPQVDQLLQRTRGMRSAAERLELYRSAERAVLADVPIIPLYHNVSTIALQPQVRGLNLTPMGISAMRLDSVWFDTDSQIRTVAR